MRFERMELGVLIPYIYGIAARQRRSVWALSERYRVGCANESEVLTVIPPT